VVECMNVPTVSPDDGNDGRVVMEEADSSDNIDDNNSNERNDQDERAPTDLCTDDDKEAASIEKKFLSISLSLLVC